MARQIFTGLARWPYPDRMSLDPDDPRPPYQQVANALRAAILTKKYAPGDQLPSGHELSKTYGVARMTIQQAIRLLRDEGLVISRQGSGVFVRARTERPVGVRPHIERAFEQAKVSIDFAGFSGETLHGVLQEPLDKIRAGRLVPESLHVRMLVPDMTVPMAIPCRAEDLGDEPALRERMHRIMLRHTQAISDSIGELAELGLVADATAEVRVHRTVPLFKLYLINRQEAFFGFYPVYEHKLTIEGQQLVTYDLGGKDTVLFHHTISDDDASTGSQYVDQAGRWFDSVWNTIGREFSL